MSNDKGGNDNSATGQNGSQEVSMENNGEHCHNNVMVTSEGNSLEVKHKGRQRPRKRKLYATICKQMEFYFSDPNVMKNRLMQTLLEENSGFVLLEKFLEFNRIKALTSDVDDLRKSLVTSDKLELSSDGSFVKRKIPFDPNKLKNQDEVDACTIYVENVPRHVDHSWLEQVFQNFGAIAYVSLPKFKSSNQPKGFAFIEFEEEESAKHCIEAYRGEGACLSLDMNPAQLMSIQTFDERSNGAGSDYGVSPKSVINSRKRKLEDNNESSEVQAKIPKSSDGEPENFQIRDPIENPDEIKNEEDSAEEKKLKRKRKKNKVKNAEDKLEGDAIFLRVLPKKVWKQLRNRYLNLQRQNMGKLKKQLREQNLRQQFYKNCNPSDDCSLRATYKSEPDSSLVEITMETAAESVDVFKKQIVEDLSCQSEEEAAISGFVRFVDYSENSLKAVVRFGDDECFSERIKNFVLNAEKVFKSARIMSVSEAANYKKQVQAELKQMKKKQPRSKTRGKDRLLAAAAKATHIRFDDDDDGCYVHSDSEETGSTIS